VDASTGFVAEMQLTKHWAANIEDYVIDLAWSPDTHHLAVASASGPVTVFAAADGATVQPLLGHEEGTNTLAWGPGGLASGGQDGKVHLWDIPSGQIAATASFDRGWVEHLAWSPAESPFLLAAAAGRELALLRPDGTVHHRFPLAPKTISALSWSPSGRHLAVAYFGGVCLWDITTLAAYKEFAYANSIHALTWSGDGKWLVSGNQDPSVHLWVPETDFEFHMSGYESKVKDIDFDHTARWLATSGGQDACVWDCQGNGPEGREPAMLPHDAKVCALAYQNRHGLLATGSEDGVVMLWSPERAKPLRATVRMPTPATKLSWSKDDRLLAVGTSKGTLYVLRSET